jgi:hypothetical protein
MDRNGFAFRLIGAVLLLALIAAGGYMVYRAGMAQGIAQAPEVAKAISQAGANGQPAPVVPMYGYGYGYPYGFGFPRFFGFFPFGICGSILFIFLFFGLLRMVFFRPWRRGWGHYGPWSKDWEGGVPPMFGEWHKRAHGQTGTEAKPEESRP